jgi:hypothetical protein
MENLNVALDDVFDTGWKVAFCGLTYMCMAAFSAGQTNDWLISTVQQPKRMSMKFLQIEFQYHYTFLKKRKEHACQQAPSYLKRLSNESLWYNEYSTRWLECYFYFYFYGSVWCNGVRIFSTRDAGALDCHILGSASLVLVKGHIAGPKV